MVLLCAGSHRRLPAGERRSRPRPLLRRTRPDHHRHAARRSRRRLRLRAARTPALDALARGGARFDRAYAAAPITLPSHATLLTGRYPPGHGARHNGMRARRRRADAGRRASRARVRDRRVRRRVSARPPVRPRSGVSTSTATACRAARTAGRNERPGRDGRRRGARVARTTIAARRVLPLGPPLRAARAVRRCRRTAGRRATALRRRDRRRGSRRPGGCSTALGDATATTLVVAAGDHGEAFGEHGEFSHSIFVYDTTLRVPLIIAGPGVPAGARVARRRSRSSTSRRRSLPLARSQPRSTVDGIDLSPALRRPRQLADARALRRVVRAAARLRMEPAARDAERRMEIHRRAEARAVRRRRSDPGETREPGRRQTRARRRDCASGSTRYSAATLPSRRRGRPRGGGAPAGAGLHVGGDGSREPRRAAGSEGSARAGRAHRAGHVGRAQGAALERGAAQHRARRSAQSAGATCASATRWLSRPLRRARCRISRAAIAAQLPVRRRPSRPAPVPGGGAAIRRGAGGRCASRSGRARQPGRHREPRAPAVGRRRPADGDPAAPARADARSRLSTRPASTWRSRTRARAGARRRRAKPPDFCVGLPADAPQRAEVERLLAGCA